MSRGTKRSAWRRHVLRSHLITDSVRVLMLELAEEMSPGGIVSVPRSDLAGRLDRDAKRITERIALAKDAGFLDVVSRARPGHTAVYAAKFPPARGADSRTHRGADGGTPKPPARGADGGEPTGKGSRTGGSEANTPSRDPSVEVTEGNEDPDGTADGQPSETEDPEESLPRRYAREGRHLRRVV